MLTCVLVVQEANVSCELNADPQFLAMNGGSFGGGILTSDGSTSQISQAYSAMVRSLENFPEAAMFLITILVHSLGF